MTVRPGRHPVSWELYRSINGIHVNKHVLTDNYTYINDITCDVDREIDIRLIEGKIHPKVIKAEATRTFTYGSFKDLKNLVRKNKEQNNLEGKIYMGDTFETDVSHAEYLLGDNVRKVCVIKVLSITPVSNPERK